MLAKRFDIQVLLVAPVALLGAGLSWAFKYPAWFVGAFVAVAAEFAWLARREAA